MLLILSTFVFARLFKVYFHFTACLSNDKKENQISLIYKEIQSRAVAMSYTVYMRKGFLIYEEMRKYFPVHEEAVSHI
jgi:hypothetical protein